MDSIATLAIEVIEVVFMYVIMVVIGGSLWHQHKNKEPLNKIHLVGFIFVIFMVIVGTITLIALFDA